MHERVIRDLQAARARTELLTDLDEPALLAQHDPLMSPLVWDLAHIGQQEELWLLREGNPSRPGMLAPDVDALYDAFRHPRADRPTLPLLPPVEARAYVHEVRGRVFDLLERTADDGLFPAAMVVQHEQQHDETMLATLQLRSGPPVLTAHPLPAGRELDSERVLVFGGPFTLGVDGADEPFSLDNERPAHTVEVEPFWIGRVPVTNAQWRSFIADRGYDERRWWSARGWAHRVEAELTRPKFWTAGGTRIRFGVEEAVPDCEPVQHICYFEAEAFAAWSGARLPTEIEWEKACAWDPIANRRRRWPWGESDPASQSDHRANLGGAALRPAPVGAYPDGASAYGAEQLIGDVWEWTASDFAPWPGFTPMIYRQYSEPFFGGDYKVLRGGSWAVAPSTVRPSFRNWDHPIRRQIFTGVRLAWDA